MSFVASFGYAAPVWYVASPKPLVSALISVPAAGEPSSSVRPFLGCVNDRSNVCCEIAISPSRALVDGGS